MGNVLEADNFSEVLWRDARKPGELRDLGVSVRQALGLQRLAPQAGKPVLGRREAILLGAFALTLHVAAVTWLASRPEPVLPDVPVQIPPMTIEFTRVAPPVVEPPPPEVIAEPEPVVEPPAPVVEELAVKPPPSPNPGRSHRSRRPSPSRNRSRRHRRHRQRSPRRRLRPRQRYRRRPMPVTCRIRRRSTRAWLSAGAGRAPCCCVCTYWPVASRVISAFSAAVAARCSTMPPCEPSSAGVSCRPGVATKPSRAGCRYRWNFV